MNKSAVLSIASTRYQKAIDKFDRESLRRDTIRGKHEVNLTDLNAARHRRHQQELTEDDLRESKKAERLRAARDLLRKQGNWEGPAIRFDLLYGSSHIWEGPTGWIVQFPDGTRRCRGCGNVRQLPRSPSAVCLHCHRSSADWRSDIQSARAKPHDPKPEAPQVGPQTRKEKRRVKVE